jgi:hypothetical protein
MGKIRKTKEKRLVGTHMHRWKDNIKMYCQGIGCEGADSIQLAQGRVH